MSIFKSRCKLSETCGESIKSWKFKSKTYFLHIFCFLNLHSGLSQFWDFGSNTECMWARDLPVIHKHWVHVNITCQKLAEYYHQTLSACEYNRPKWLSVYGLIYLHSLNVCRYQLSFWPAIFTWTLSNPLLNLKIV